MKISSVRRGGNFEKEIILVQFRQKIGISFVKNAACRQDFIMI